MRRYKIFEFSIHGKVASGIIKGLWYRVVFDHIPIDQEAKRALMQAASYTIGS